MKKIRLFPPVLGFVVWNNPTQFQKDHDFVTMRSYATCRMCSRRIKRRQHAIQLTAFFDDDNTRIRGYIHRHKCIPQIAFVFGYEEYEGFNERLRLENSNPLIIDPPECRTKEEALELARIYMRYSVYDVCYIEIDGIRLKDLPIYAEADKKV